MRRGICGSSAAAAVLVSVLATAAGFRCPREPTEEHSRMLRSPGDNGYRVLVSGQPDMYVPEAVYTLSIVGSRTHGRLQMFSRFILNVEPADPNGDPSPQKVGTFQLFGDSLTAFNDACINTVSEANDLPKTEVQVMWTAPPKGTGCIVFRAMVLEDENNWWADDGNLSHELCELPSLTNEPLHDEESANTKCCACDEAKYQMVFEGIWSNETHPKDFPFSLWLTHFSDIIGASHEQNFSFWGEGQIATDGLRMVAEWGSVRGMESELRANSKHLRSLIKAAGLWYPHVNTNTTATFRVDQHRPLVSLVSMLGPTPDWIVGVSGLNLCKRDCTWTEQKIINLYPYDAGTDSGITYMSPNSPTIPRERIHRITTMYPEDPRAPFYDPAAQEMLPLARLYLFRDSITAKNCDDKNIQTGFGGEILDEVDNAEDSARPECAVNDYSDWSACSVTCGKGLRMRQRFYVNPQKAEMLGCGRQLVSKEMCVALDPACPGVLDDEDQLFREENSVCTTSDWNEWSECSVTCGVGIAMRSRRFLDRMGHKKCPHVSLVEKEKCMQPVCRGQLETEINDPQCPVSDWTVWSPCSASCGKGVKLRTRLLLVAPEHQETCSSRLELVQTRPCVEKQDCRFDVATAKQVCMMEADPGPCRGYFERWYYEPQKGMCVPFGYGGCRGNRNNFMTAMECNEICGGIRNIQEGTGTNNIHTEDGYNGQSPLNCVVSSWGAWSPCNEVCGKGTQQRSRVVLVHPQNGGKPCPKRLVRKRKCQDLPPC